MTTSAPLVSVVVAIAGPEGHPAAVIDEFGKSLTGGGYRCEFVVVLDGPGTRFEDQLREVGARWPLRIVRLEGGGWASRSRCRPASPRSPATSSSTCRRTCRSSPRTC